MLPTQASAATDFLTFKNISGSSTDAAHKGAIDINTFNWGLSVAGGGGAGGAGKPVFSDFSWTQWGYDISFPTLFVNTAQGKHIPTAVVDLVKPGQGKQSFSYLTMTFSDVVLTSLYIAGNSGNVPIVSGSFAYSKVALTVTPELGNGLAGKPITGEWDLDKNEGSLFDGSPLLLMQIANMSAPVQALAVPEAETYAMMLAGLALIGWRASRRRLPH